MASGDTTPVGSWLRGRQRPARPYIRLAAIAGTMAGLATIVQMGGIAWIAHGSLVEGLPGSDLVLTAIAVLIAMALRALGVTAQHHFAARSSDEVRGRLREELLEQYGRLGPARVSEYSAGTLATEWIDQVDALHGYYAHYLPQMILCISVPLMVLATVLWLDWLAALFLLFSAPLIPLFMALVGMGAEKLNQQHMAMLGRLSGHFLDRVRGLTTLQIFQYTGPATAGIAAVTDEYRRTNLKTLRVAFLSSAVLEFFASVAIAVIAIYIGFGLLGYIAYGPSPDLTLFSGLFVLLLAPEFFQPLRQLAQHYHDRAAAMGAAAELQRRLEAGHPPRATVVAPDVPPHPQDAIRLSDLSRTFPDGRVGLTAVSTVIRGGELVLLEGHSGSGKSTLLNILAGFMPPSSGRVHIFGQRPGSEPFGWLSQTPFIRHGTWSDNLRLAAPEASDDDLLSALEQVGLLRLVHQRPAGLATAIEEGGTGLSGGQARRLALARLFLVHYRLVLMDEPTAGLDARSEQHVIEAIQALRNRGTTVVIASHHEAFREIADRRLVLENGRLTDG